MPTVTSSFSVDSSSTAWTPGPAGVTRNQLLVVHASGSVLWITGKYSEVEGGYGANGFPFGHALNLRAVGQPNPANPVTNVPGLSLAVLAVPARVVPGPLTPGAGRGDALVPRWSLDADGVTRVARFFSSDMENATSNVGPWDIYFGYVDGGYADNVGTFAVTADVTDVDLQPAGQVIGLPGHQTDADLERAAFCSFSGLLTPGNRLRSTGRGEVADIFAPFCDGAALEDR